MSWIDGRTIRNAGRQASWWADPRWWEALRAMNRGLALEMAERLRAARATLVRAGLVALAVLAAGCDLDLSSHSRSNADAGGCATCGPTTPGGGAVSFSCEMEASGSACIARWAGIGQADIRVRCPATAHTPGVDSLMVGQGSGVRVDPIAGAGGPHECVITLEDGGATVGGPVTQQFRS